MRAVFMEVANVPGEESFKVALVHWDNVVKHVAPTASDPALRCSYFASVIALPLRRNASPDLQSALGRTSDYTVPNTWWHRIHRQFVELPGFCNFNHGEYVARAPTHTHRPS